MVPVSLTLKRKYLVVGLVPSLVAMVVMTILAINYLHKMNFEQQKELLENHSNFLNFKLSQSGLSLSDDALVQFINQYAESHHLNIALTDTSGKIILSSENNSYEPGTNIRDRLEISEALQNNQIFISDKLNSREEILLFSAFSIQSGVSKGELVHISKSLNQAYKVFDFIHMRYIGSLILLFLIMSFLSARLISKVSAALVLLRKPITSYIHGNYAKGIERNTDIAIEISRLERSISKLRLSLDRRKFKGKKNRIEINSILSTMKEGLITISKNGTISQMNKSAKKLFLLDGKVDYTGKALIEVVRNPQLHEVVREVDEDHSYIKRRISQFNNNEYTHIQIRASLLISENNEKLGTLVVLNDITEFVRFEQDRKDFVANVSHELKTPLTSIAGYAETLLNGAINDPKVNIKFLEKIKKHSGRLKAIIEDLLDLSKLHRRRDDGTPIKFTFQSISKIVSDVIEGVEDLLKTKSISIINNLPENEFIIPVHEVLLSQGIKNLLENAIKYSGSNSEISVTYLDLEQNVEIRVSDKGQGIEQRHLKRIFERFYRVDQGRSRDAGGTGLGLALVKHIVLAHNGKIRAESEVGKGTTFIITLPKHQTN